MLRYDSTEKNFQSLRGDTEFQGKGTLVGKKGKPNALLILVIIRQ